jgi:hypothetical protein
MILRVILSRAKRVLSEAKELLLIFDAKDLLFTHKSKADPSSFSLLGMTSSL